MSDWSGPSNYSGGNLPPRSRNAQRPTSYNERYAGGRNRSRQQDLSVGHAQALASHLLSRGIKAEHLETMHPNIARHHAMAAGIPNPGDEVWTMTHKMLRAHQQAEESGV